MMAMMNINQDEFSALFAIREAALALSTAMVEAEERGANFDLVDDEWAFLTSALETYRAVRHR